MLIAPVSARITLPAFFTDNMVVQQNSMLTLEGKAKPQRTVTVVASWNKQKIHCQIPGRRFIPVGDTDTCGWWPVYIDSFRWRKIDIG